MSEPVLIMAFNRPDHLQVLLNRLREVRPDRVFVAVDGARDARPDEADRVQACRDLVATIDWPCDVQTLFQDHNLGCGLGVSTAITWFFTHVERGIILEDDIIPDPSFFPYCAELLDRYQDDARVFAISGCNFVPPGCAVASGPAVSIQPGAAHLGLGHVAPLMGAAPPGHRRLAAASCRR